MPLRSSLRRRRGRWALLRGLAAVVAAGLAAGLAAPAWAQQPARVRGFVTDAADGQALQGVNVALRRTDGLLRGTSTDADGFYTVGDLPAGRYVLRASYLGYRAVVDTLDLAPGTLVTRDAALQTEESVLGEVVVESERTRGAAGLTAGRQTATPADVARVPTPDVSGDLAAYLTTLPGVVSTGDRGGQLFIRGGEPSQNLVLVDGLVVYQPFHVLGFYSAFPADLLSQVDLYAGGYGGRYGGRLSSVIDVQTRTGNKRAWEGAVSAAPFVSGVRAEGPLGRGGRTSVLASARRSVVEEIAAPYLGERLPFAFSDVFGKVHARVRSGAQLSVTGLHTYDRGTIEEDLGGIPPDEVTWTNTAVGGRFLYTPARYPMLVETVVSYVNFYGQQDYAQGDGTIGARRWSEVSRMGGSADITYYTGRADVHWGLFAHTTGVESVLGGLYQDLDTDLRYVTEVGLYLEPEVSALGRRLWITPGLRLHHIPKWSQTFLEPRVRARYETGPHRVAAAVGRYHQSVVGVADRRDATGVFTAWVATPPLGEVPAAWHVLGGYGLRLGAGVDLAAEVYYKRLRPLFVGEWTAFPRLTDRLQSARGRVLGLDLRAELRRGRVYGYVGYGLATVRYEALGAALPLWYGEEALRYRPAHDRRHAVNGLVATTLAGVELSARWEFGSGLPFSRALGFDGFVLLDGGVDVFTEPGSRRVIYERPFRGLLPTYHRLDVAAERAWTLGRARVTAQASLINAYDRRNLFYLDTFTLRRVDQLPLVPALGLEVAFR